MTPGARRLLVCVWLCFLARGAFYSVLLPLWEGYDEWSHFASIQLAASRAGLPGPGQTRVSREVQESLKLVPLPYGHHPLGHPFLTHDAYWRLPEEQRSALARRLVALPREWAGEPATDPLVNYEARQQPPLYYWMLAPLERAARGVALPGRVILIRLAGLLLVSLTIPVGFAAARRVFASDGAAVGVAALISAMPGFLMAATRVSNDGLSALIFALLLWAVLDMHERFDWSRALLAGALLGAGLVTKAYFLTAVPALAVTSLWWLWRSRDKLVRAAARVAIVFGAAGAISAWWYWRNYVLTGSWSGLQQVAARSDLSLGFLAGRIPGVDWRRFFDSAFLTHIWSGNWSFLQLRSWMYHVFAGVAMLAAAGLLLLLWRDQRARPRLLVLSSFYGFFWLGLCYHELTFSVLGFSSGAGWYLYALVVAEALLAALGLTALCPARWRGWVLPGVTALFALVDLYGTHFLLAPYYTGMIGHGVTGSLESFHLSQFGGGGLQTMVNRMTLAAPVSVFHWLCYLAATLALPLIARPRLS